jgi:hypothetical protein
MRPEALGGAVCTRVHRDRGCRLGQVLAVCTTVAWIMPEPQSPLAGAGICVVISVTSALTMAPESLSFRITRNTEDLAHTIHALSQRVVRLEQRLAALELQVDHQQEPASDPQELHALDTVERVLADCRELLADASQELQPECLQAA